MNKIDKTFEAEGKYYICLDIEGEELWTAQHRPELNRGAIISEIIRKKYSADDVEAILANGSDTEKHAQELTAFHTFRTAVKTALAEIWDEIEAINEEWRKKQEAEKQEAITQDGEEVTE